ncbi:electron transport protein SCO1/SenC [Catenovulum agarivorans DS-2]|uniref:Electron transport protein SCO1/SenC n=1 Tax=Catenovulum agarivorans DS-2 TaxID=1328313 RepID=W7QH98_9ALTE|nr:SCO family protein [Catenovulum agarivorans]EWH08332.1 electron transport protein SCO1/SenC [Catenovulum agarivorans DS-2]
MKIMKLLNRSTWYASLMIVMGSLSAGVLAQLPDSSVYHLESTWTDQNSQPLKWQNLQGKNQVVSLIYTHCLHTCPTIVSTMHQAQQKLSAKTLANTEFVLVSLTPDSDTPQVLNEFAKKHGLDTTKWRLLTGDDESVRQLAMVLQFKYQNIPDNEVSHSNIVTVLNRQGEIALQTLGEPKRVGEIVNILEKLE